MYNFCTLFDAHYVHKGLAMYESLKDLKVDFKLYILAIDDSTADLLFKLALDDLIVLTMDQIENDALLNVKDGRNKAEYIWTCGPSLTYFVLTEFQLPHITYLDADLMFFHSPKEIFDEIGSNSVGLTDHYRPVNDDLHGRYNVQFVYFKNDKIGLEALQWWMDSCIEWCFARVEGNRYGDQKYLEGIAENFENVWVVRNRGAGVAMWNVDQYKISEFSKISYEKDTYNLIFYHFHGVRFSCKNELLTLSTVTYDLSADVMKYIYLPYLDKIKLAYVNYLNVSVKSVALKERTFFPRFYSLLKRRFREFRFVRFIYYRVLKVKYIGYESKKIP
jgi:hypothetical protein